MRKIDYSIYYVTDDELLYKGYDLYKSVEHSIIGGATIIQLREKNTSTRDFLQKAIKIKQICDKYEVPLIINDRIDIALAVDSAGVHLGQDDMPIQIARKILGKDKIIGISTGNLRQAQEAQKNGADYIGVGAMYSTSTKKDADLTTIKELKQIRENVNIPIVVIGGINENTIADFKGIGIDGLAIVSAISLKENHILSTKKLKHLFYENDKISSAVFDIDGTMVETIDIWDKVIYSLMEKYNFTYSDEDMKYIWNNGFDKTSLYTIEKFKLGIKKEQFFEDIKQLSIKEYKNTDIKLKNGIKKLLSRLKDNNIKLSVCTSLSKEQYETVLNKVGLIEYFDYIISSQDEKIEKSDCLLYEKIAKKLNLDAKNTIVFDDDKNASFGVKNAGMRMCLISNKKYEIDDFVKSFIDYTIENFENIDFV